MLYGKSTSEPSKEERLSMFAAFIAAIICSRARGIRSAGVCKLISAPLDLSRTTGREASSRVLHSEPSCSDLAGFQSGRGLVDPRIRLPSALHGGNMRRGWIVLDSLGLSGNDVRA